MTSARRLVVNPIQCDAHGLCAELLPELIQLDDWGFPIVSPEAVPRHLEAHAQRAVAACPTLALLLSGTVTRPDPGRRAHRCPPLPESPFLPFRHRSPRLMSPTRLRTTGTPSPDR